MGAFPLMNLRRSAQTTLPRLPWLRALFSGGLVLAGLATWTAWSLTHSEALVKAHKAYARGDLSRSLQHALDHLVRRPWSGEAALVAARCLSRLDYADAAEPYYKRAGRLELGDLQIRAYGLVRCNHRQRAIDAYEEILTRWPDNVTALRRLAAVHLSQSNIPAILKLTESLDRIPDGAAIGATLRGVVAHNDKDYEQAIAAFLRVLELDPDLRDMPLPRDLFWSHLADDLLACGRFEETAHYLTKALEKGLNAHLLGLLGRAYALQGNLNEAESCFHQAAELDPKNYAPHLELGKLELQRQHFNASLKHLDQAMALSPGQIDVLYIQARAYRLLGRTADADGVDKTISQLRHDPPPSSQPGKVSWPRYAL
jgi:tetratricopeptide (TPR) repeat protein